MKSVLFRGIEVEYNEKSLRNYGIQYAIAEGGAESFKAMDVVFGGQFGDKKSLEVAELIGGTMDDMAELINAISEAEGDDTKN